MSLINFAQDIRRSMANVNSSDHSHLNIWLQEERDVVKTLEQLNKEQQEASKFMLAWGKRELEDIQDLTKNMFTLQTKTTEIQQQYSEDYEAFRKVVKEIKNAEETLSKLKSVEKSLLDRYRESQKKGKQTDYIKLELDSAAKVVAAAEAKQHGEKRRLLQRAFTIQAQCLHEMSIKTAIVAQHCLLLSQHIPQTQIAPGEMPPKYNESQKTCHVIDNCFNSLKEWRKVASHNYLSNNTDQNPSTCDSNVKKGVETNESRIPETLTPGRSNEVGTNQGSSSHPIPIPTPPNIASNVFQTPEHEKEFSSYPDMSSPSSFKASTSVGSNIRPPTSHHPLTPPKLHQSDLPRTYDQRSSSAVDNRTFDQPQLQSVDSRAFHVQNTYSPQQQYSAQPLYSPFLNYGPQIMSFGPSPIATSIEVPANHQYAYSSYPSPHQHFPLGFYPPEPRLYQEYHKQ